MNQIQSFARAVNCFAESKIGTFSRSQKSGRAVISMKNEWKRVFAYKNN